MQLVIAFGRAERRAGALFYFFGNAEARSFRRDFAEIPEMRAWADRLRGVVVVLDKHVPDDSPTGCDSEFPQVRTTRALDDLAIDGSEGERRGHVVLTTYRNARALKDIRRKSKWTHRSTSDLAA